MKRNHKVLKRDVGDIDASSFLFNSKHNDSLTSLPIVVPETPTHSPCPSATLATISNIVSIMETPDEKIKNRAQDISKCKEGTNSRGFESFSHLHMNDASELDITPDLNLVRRKKLLSILESEHSFTSSLQSREEKNSSMIPHQTENGRKRKRSNTPKEEIVSPKLRRKRRSLAEVILPFDLNDTERLSNKLNLLKDLESKSRVSSPTSKNRQTKERKSSTPDKQRRPLKSSDLLMSLRRSPRTLQKASGNKTIHFDSEDVIMTPVQGRGVSCDQTTNSNNIAGENKLKNLNLLKTSTGTHRENQKYSYYTSETSNSKTLQSKVETSQQEKMNLSNAKECDAEKEETSVSSVDPCTVLNGIVAYVEVRMESDNRSGVIKDQLRALGADVRDRFCHPVTHVIFKDGSKSVFMRARKRKLHLLSSLWVEACRVKLTRVPESLYPSCSLEHYSTLIPGRLRKMRSMQPKEFSEEEQLAAKRAERRRLKLSAPTPPQTVLATTSEHPVFSPQTRSKIPAEDIGSPLFGISHLLTPRRRTSSASSSSKESEEQSISGDDGVEEQDYKTPLAKRLYKRFFSPKAESEPRNFKVAPPGVKNHHTASCENLSPSSLELNRLEIINGWIESSSLGDKEHRNSDQNLENSEGMTSLRLSSDNDSSLTINSLDLPVRLNFVSPEPSTSRKGDLGKNKGCNSAELEGSSSDFSKKRKYLEKKKSEELKESRCRENCLKIFDSVTSDQLNENCDKNTIKCKINKVKGPGENTNLNDQFVSTRKKPANDKNIKSAPDTEFQKENSSMSDTEVSPQNRYTIDSNESVSSQRITKEKASSGQQTTRVKINSLHCMPNLPEMTCSQARRHKLLSLDSLEPSQELIVPVTPNREDKRDAGAYTELQVVDSRTQRKAIRDKKDIKNYIPPPRTKQKNERKSSTTKDEGIQQSSGGKDDVNINTQKMIKGKKSKQSVGESQKPRAASVSELHSSGEDGVFEEGTITLLPRPRRSTDEFKFDGVLKSKRKNFKSHSSKLMSICLTSLNSKEKSTVLRIIKKLGESKICEEVGPNTTHVVCGSERRTLALLHGIARGCWILNDTWIHESLKMGHWTPEEAYEMFVFAPAAKICREKRLSQGAAYNHTLFSGVGSIYVTEGCSPQTASLKELLMLCGATVVGSVRCANLVVGPTLYISKQRECAGPAHVSEKWVLDCVMQHKVLPTRDYTER